VKGKRTDLAVADCAIARSLHVIGDWWSLLLVRESFLGVQRFGEFQKSVGLAKNILADRLKKLVREGILNVETDASQPSVHRYVLTEKGERLYVVLVALWQWGERFCDHPPALTGEFVDVKTGEQLTYMLPMAGDGRSIGPRDFKLAPKRERKTRRQPARKSTAGPVSKRRRSSRRVTSE